jgi:alcohol dehydrogenase class IV
MTGNWNYPAPIRFGAGRVKEAGEACRELGISKPLIVTDADLAALPPVANTRQALEKAGLSFHMFAKVKANPDEQVVTDGVEAYREGGCDGVLALGGGSPLDAGKAIALMVGQTRPIFDFVDEGDNYKRVNEAGVAPVVAIPTTAGTGSEVGRVSIITNSATKLKRLIFHPLLVPGRVIADPELTVGMPQKLTAATGMDALAHNLEAFCSPTFHPMADGIALEGMRLISESLERAYTNGSDLDARAKMLAASIMGSAAFQKGLGAIHSLSHPLGGKYGTHHGMLNAVLMPYVLEFNKKALGNKWQLMKEVLGDDPLNWVLGLRQRLAIPNTLSELGIPDEAVELAAAATRDPSASTNPVPLDDQAHKQLLEDALSGFLKARQMA